MHSDLAGFWSTEDNWTSFTDEGRTAVNNFSAVSNFEAFIDLLDVSGQKIAAHLENTNTFNNVALLVDRVKIQ